MYSSQVHLNFLKNQCNFQFFPVITDLPWLRYFLQVTGNHLAITDQVASTRESYVLDNKASSYSQNFEKKKKS